MKIIKLTPSKRVKDRYYADLEDGKSIKLTINQIADYGLYTGRDLSNKELALLQTDAYEAELRAKGLRMTGARAMSRREVIDRLKEKGADEKAAEETADWLECIGILNDAEYAGMIVRHYTSRGYGVGKVRDELYRRGVPKELWDAAMGEYSTNEETIDKLVAAKLKDPDDEKAVKKVTAMLLRRGFKWDEVRSALERIKISVEESEYDM